MVPQGSAIKIPEADRVRARALAFLGLVLAGAFYMPLRDHVGEWTYQCMLLPVTLVTGFFLARVLAQGVRVPGLSEAGWPGLTGLVGCLLQGLSLLLLLVAVHKFRAFSYLPNWSVVVTGYLLSMAAFAWLGWRQHAGRRAWALLILGSYAFGMLAAIAYFPLDTGRSDMLFMLRTAGQAWMAQGPAAVYVAPPGTLVTYLPGLWLTYLPATLAGIDLRFVSLAAVLGLGSFLLTARANETGFPALFLLCVLLLNPWIQFRHESYVHGLLFFAGLFAWALMRDKVWLASLAMAWMATQSQLSWPFIPFYLVYLFRVRGMAQLLFAKASLIAALAWTLLPFLIASPGQFWANCFAGWMGHFEADSPNMSFWVTRILPWRHLRLFQAAALASLFLFAWRRLSSLNDLFKWSTLAVFLFILSNSPIRDYFFLFPFVFAACFVATSPAPFPAPWWRGEDPQRRYP